MLKNYLEEGVNHFVKKSKRRAIQYAQETMFYSMYSKVYIYFKQLKKYVKMQKLIYHF